MRPIDAVVIGASAGGNKALQEILSNLSSYVPFSIIAVIHMHCHSKSTLCDALNDQVPITVKEAEHREPIKMGVAYLAPPNYHLMIESNRTLALSIDEPVNYCRPSVDVLFETAACVFQSHLMGILLSGANADGGQGMKQIKNNGGLAVVQDPTTALVSMMPQSGIESTNVDHILPPKKIGQLLATIDGTNHQPGSA